jgi:hypothetical protein
MLGAHPRPPHPPGLPESSFTHTHTLTRVFLLEVPARPGHSVAGPAGNPPVQHGFSRSYVCVYVCVCMQVCGYAGAWVCPTLCPAWLVRGGEG